MMTDEIAQITQQPQEQPQEKKPKGRPKKIKEQPTEPQEPKKGRGRPLKPKKDPKHNNYENSAIKLWNSILKENGYMAKPFKPMPKKGTEEYIIIRAIYDNKRQNKDVENVENKDVENKAEH